MSLGVPRGATVAPFSGQSWMAGIDLPGGQSIRKGAPDEVLRFVKERASRADVGMDDANPWKSRWRRS